MLRIFLGDRFGRRNGRFAIVLVTVACIAVMGGLVMLLWNWLMPALFAGAWQIDYWQALGLLLLSKILFGGGRGYWNGHRQHRESLTQKEREQLKDHFKNHRSRHFDIDRGYPEPRSSNPASTDAPACGTSPQDRPAK